LGKKTITFPPDTTGTLDNNNGLSFALHFWLGAGSTFTSGTLNTSWASQTDANRAVGQVNIADSTSNDWYITGVQLEAGTTASDFEFLPV
jgi:IS4 transposase